MTTRATWPEPVGATAAGPGMVRVSNVNVTPSAGFVDWLMSTGAALVVTTGNGVLVVGVRDGELAHREHTADVAMGLVASGPRTLHLATRWQVHRLEDAVGEGRGPGGEERLMVNQHSRTTGFVGAYDLAVDAHGRVLLSTTLANGIATPADRANLAVVARPPFVSADVVEERCHVTGLALDEDGELAYLTAAAETDEPAGWQPRVADGGVVVDVHADRVLARGLSLPCSPRVHDGALLVANAGTGELLRVDRTTGETSVIAAVPGVARGLTFVGGRAVLGCSVPPQEGPYLPLPVAQDPPARARQGLAVVDVATGVVEHSVTIDAGSGDVHAVAAVEGARRVDVRLNGVDRDGWFVVG